MQDRALVLAWTLAIGSRRSNGRSPLGWTLLGAQGRPALTVPAGSTTEVS